MSDALLGLRRGRTALINGLTQFTINVWDLEQARGRGFPEDFLVFTKSPFRFDFSRSKKTFRTGMIYRLKIEMNYVNGRKAANQRINIRYYEGNEGKNMPQSEYTINDRGQLVAPVLAVEQQQLHFQVYSIDFPGQSADFYVQPYIGNNRMVMEKVERDNEQFIQAYTNMNSVSRFTGIMMMIVSRGEMVYTLFNQPTNEINIRMENHILKKVSPGARLLAFYVDKHGDGIVADSTKFAVDAMCRGDPLKVKTDTATLDPGASCNLTVTGPSDMWVGFNVMDKASFSLNSASILKHDTNAGLTILTNANADQAALTRNSEYCDIAKPRGRRSASKLKCHPEMQHCCHIGELFADRLLEWKFNQLEYKNIEADLNPRDDYKGREKRSIFLVDDQYRKDINTLLELDEFLRKRSHLEASFFFEEYQLQNGIFQIGIKFRDSVTERSIQAIGISESGGACIAESVDVKTYKPFFIQLDLPYKASRFRRFDIKAAIFNNYDQTQNASVYLIGADGLCYGALPGKNSPQRRVELVDMKTALTYISSDNFLLRKPNSAHTVSFSAIPLVAGDITVTVSAFVTSDTSAKADVIERKLHVVNEGIMETKQIHVCLDPNKQMEACSNSPQVTANEPVHGEKPVRTYELDLILLAQFLTGTGSATAYIESILRQLSKYQKAYGSYAAYKHISTSLWKAYERLEYISYNQKGTGYFVDDNPVSAKYMQVIEAVSNAKGYLEVLPDRTFVNKYMLAITTYALALSHSELKGNLKTLLLQAATERDNMMYWSDHNGNEATASDVETTAYALLAFVKFDDIRTSGKIVTWLTGQKKAIGGWHMTQGTVIALQALAEYSLQTNHREVNLEIEIRNKQTLQKVSVTNENVLLRKVIPELLVKGQNNQFWVTVAGSGTAIMNIELRWNRKALHNENCYFDVSPIEIDTVNPAFSASSRWRFLLKNKPCDVCGRCPGDDIENENDGIDYNDVDDAIHQLKKREADDETSQKCVIFDVKTVDSDMSLMAIVRVNLETGVIAIEDDFKELMANGVIDRYEMPKDGMSFAIFYINEISQVPRKFIFRLEDHFQDSTARRQPATVLVYDYYKPEKKCIRSYGIGDNHGQEVGFRCDENNDQCECMQGKCSSPVDEELFDYTVKFSKLPRNKKPQTTKPEDIIANYACNLEKANFVYKVTIEEICFDATTMMRCDTAVINSVILAGNKPQQLGDKIALEWNLTCRHPDLRWGKTYYIVGKDPTIYNDYGSVTKARYELMGTTLVIDPSYKPILRTVMNRFERQMAKNDGCFH